MAKFTNLPRVESVLPDGGLTVVKNLDLGSSILIVGTAEDGPTNEPSLLTKREDAVTTFGSILGGTLVRGVYEAWNASRGNKDIRALRISNGNKGFLGLAEVSTGTGEDAPTYSGGQAINAMTIEALYPGAIYNNVSIRREIVTTAESNRDCVIVYNPKTGEESLFSYNSDPDIAADVHDVKELVDAINADPNLNTAIEAEITDLTAEYEFDIRLPASGTVDIMASGVSQINNLVYVDLSEKTEAFASGSIHDMSDCRTATFTQTAGNRLIEIQECYEVATASGQWNATTESYDRWDSAGRASWDLDYIVLTPCTDDEILSVSGVAGDGNAQMWQEVRNAHLGTTDGSDEGPGTSANPFIMDSVYACPDDGDTGRCMSEGIDNSENHSTLGTSTVSVYATDEAGTTTALTSGNYTLTYKPTDNQLEVYLNTTPIANRIYTVDYDSVPVDLTEHATLTACRSGGTYTDYFISGKRITFGATQPTDIKFIYKYKRILIPGGDVEIYDSKKGEIRFINRDKQPALGTNTGTDDLYGTIGITYTYLPEWANITTAASNLNGGSDGTELTGMTNAQKYDELETAFDEIASYDVDIIVLMNTYLDDTKYRYDLNTGVRYTVNAGFHTLLGNHLSDLAQHTNEAIGIMSVAGPTTTSLANVNDWYKKLSVQDDGDPTRAANIMAALDNKFLNICAMNPVFTNEELVNSYIGTGEALYAGLVSTLPPEEAPTNQPLAGIVGASFRLSDPQLDVLTGARYVTMRNRPGRGIVVTSAPSAAVAGSDYQRLSTVRIVFAAMDVVREVCDPFLGQPNHMETLAAMDTAITRGLHSMVQARALRDYDFTIQSTPDQAVLGEVNIELVLVPSFEITRITVTVKLRKTL